MICIQNDPKSELIELHVDEAGIDYLIQLLNTLREYDTNDIHLFTQAWGGDGLDSDPQNLDLPVTNQLKIMKWPAPPQP
jgi:hypothetical protein